MEQSQHDPRRLSALYQYHNAPEVAPAHGLEYDDTIHSASSDKYPVVHPRTYESTNVDRLYGNDRPPRIIFGMKVRTFLMVAALLVVIIISAAVGGAVGGKNMHENDVQASSSWPTDIGQSSRSSSSASPSSTSTQTSSSYLAAVPTYTPLNPCPNANNTIYTSSQATRQNNSTSDTASLTFTRYCDVDPPLDTVNSASKMSEAFVYSLDDCAELCASLNFWANDSNCTVAVYDVRRSRPANCVVGKADDARIGDLEQKEGIAVAILRT